MRLKLLLLVTALAAIITACGEPVRSGVVVEKDYEPPREWTSQHAIRERALRP